MSELPPDEYHRQMQQQRAELRLVRGEGKPKRMTLSEIVELLLARGAPEHSSVSLSRNSKGETQIEVTVRTDRDAGVLTIDDAAAKVIETYDTLRARYPMSSGYVGAQPADKPAEPAGAPVPSETP